jgi:glycosyltransferase involved in cell wall biosynthesis
MSDITIITICYNNLQDLINTCISVDKQQSEVFEHLIIDGSSKPDIKNYLEQNYQPAYRRWICERDNGISDAFNKGIVHAKGDIIHLLNSGDIYFDDTVLKKVSENFIPDNAITWCHGKMNMKRGGSWVIIGNPFDKTKVYRGMRGTFHPTMFVTRALYNKYGFFDTSLTIAMDYDFLLRIANENFKFLNFPIVTFDPYGISNSTYFTALKETKVCYEKYFGKSIKLILWQLRLKLLDYLLKSPIGNFLYGIKKGLGMENV